MTDGEPPPGETVAPPAVDDLRSSIDSLRDQLLDGLPARVQGMAEELILEWSAAVEAVPELARVATAEVIRLLRMAPAEREFDAAAPLRPPPRRDAPGGGADRHPRAHPEAGDRLSRRAGRGPARKIGRRAPLCFEEDGRRIPATAFRKGCT